MLIVFPSIMAFKAQLAISGHLASPGALVIDTIYLATVS
jgi:hypothetical protein